MGQSQSSDGEGNKCLEKTEETTLECVVQSVSEDGERSAIEEKLKEVICKTVVNIPLTDGKPSDENSVVCSIPQSSSSCVDLEGKLLVKVIKASGLTGKEETDIPDAYCVITCREPRQKKKTISIKGSKDPFWNESHVLDISKKTKEIAFDVYNELKTLEGKKFHLNDYSEKSSDADSDFLGQVIVPLAMITKDQSCRLILPILPISKKTSYVTGQISLEFTYDKDGKAFETETQSQTASSKSAKTTIVANKVADVEETIQRSPQKVVFSMATLDIVEDEDDQFHFEPLEDHGIGREDIVMAEQRVSAGLPPTAGGHVGSENDDILVQENAKHDEMLQELIELDSRTTSKVHAKNEVKPNKVESKDDNERPPSRQSKQSSRATSPSSPCQITITPASEQSLSSPTSPVDTVNEGGAPVQLDETLMEDLTPDTRRKVFRQAFSMRINSTPEPSNLPKEDGEKPSSTFESRHSFSAGDKITPKTKSGSDVSLTSLYEGTKSILVVESKDRGEVKYHQIPPLMAKRGTFDHKGTKLHICNDHLFVAKHFGGSLPSCSVCESPLTGYFGKQGYVCRDCKMITHKRCHLETKSVCPNSTLASLKIKKAASIYGYK